MIELFPAAKFCFKFERFWYIMAENLVKSCTNFTFISNVMSKDLDYFAEFLANPAAYEFNEFYRMAGAWSKYIRDHKEDFNYLEDDQWKEIRERLLTELNKRETHRREVEEDWKDLCSTLEHIEMFNDKDAIRVMTRQNWIL